MVKMVNLCYMYFPTVKNKKQYNKNYKITIFLTPSSVEQQLGLGLVGSHVATQLDLACSRGPLLWFILRVKGNMSGLCKPQIFDKHYFGCVWEGVFLGEVNL